jgi:cytochrome c oxidase subunit 2
VSDSIECHECGAHLKAENETAHMRRVHPNVTVQPRNERRSHEPRPRFYVTSGTKKALFAVLVVAVVIVAGVMLLQSSQKSVPIDASATQVHVSMSGFDPSTITVKAGTPLKIDLINMDNQYHTDSGGWHNFAMDDFSMNVSVEPLGQKVITVPTSTPGTYGWYCSVCCGGRESPSMNGRVVVQP